MAYNPIDDKFIESTGSTPSSERIKLGFQRLVAAKAAMTQQWLALKQSDELIELTMYEVQSALTDYIPEVQDYITNASHKPTAQWIIGKHLCSLVTAYIMERTVTASNDDCGNTGETPKIGD